MDLKKSILAYKGIRFDIRRCDIQTKKGHTKPFEAIIHPGAAVILPLYDHQSVIMIRNQRYAVDKDLWELPAGTLEPNEDPLVTASRELTEETGYKANLVEPLTTFYPSPGISNEVMYAYIAKELHWVGQNLDDSEEITPEIIPWKALLDMIQKGQILDAKTILTLLFYKNFHLEM